MHILSSDEATRLAIDVTDFVIVRHDTTIGLSNAQGKGLWTAM
jgi:hypothetical protein